MSVRAYGYRFVFASAVGAAAFVPSLSPRYAHAGAFAIREQSAYEQGASFAGEAVCGDSVAGTFWNSAVVNCAQGLVVEGSLTGIFPKSDITTNPFPGSLFGSGSPFGNFGDPGNIGEAALVPSAIIAYGINDHWSVGMTVNAPFGLSTESEFNSAAQIYGRKSEVTSYNFNPVVGYRVNDVFSFGAGVQIQYFDVKLTQAISPLPNAPSAELKGDDIGWGFTAGVLITPTPDTEIGIGYRSWIKQSVDGNLTIPTVGVLPVTTEPTLPDMISASFRQRLTPAFTLMGTAEWTNWSRFSTFAVTSNVTGTPVTYLPFEYDDGWFFSLGGEYALTDQWTVRGGVGWEISPISDQVRSVRLPDDDRLWLSVGATYAFNESLSLNIGYSFLTTFGTTINIGPGNPAYIAPVTYSADVDANVNIVSVGLKYRWGGLDKQREAAVYKP
jgi:long-chain fatty acid transport protein